MLARLRINIRCCRRTFELTNLISAQRRTRGASGRRLRHRGLTGEAQPVKFRQTVLWRTAEGGECTASLRRVMLYRTCGGVGSVRCTAPAPERFKPRTKCRHKLLFMLHLHRSWLENTQGYNSNDGPNRTVSKGRKMRMKRGDALPRQARSLVRYDRGPNSSSARSLLELASIPPSTRHTLSEI